MPPGAQCATSSGTPWRTAGRRQPAVPGTTPRTAHPRACRSSRPGRIRRTRYRGRPPQPPRWARSGLLAAWIRIPRHGSCDQPSAVEAVFFEMRADAARLEPEIPRNRIEAGRVVEVEKLEGGRHQRWIWQNAHDSSRDAGHRHWKGKLEAPHLDGCQDKVVDLGEGHLFRTAEVDGLAVLAWLVHRLNQAGHQVLDPQGLQLAAAAEDRYDRKLPSKPGDGCREGRAVTKQDGGL